MIVPTIIKLINSILGTRNYPNVLKIAKVVQTFKKVYKERRPTFLLSIFDKIFGKVVHKRLIGFI